MENTPQRLLIYLNLVTSVLSLNTRAELLAVLYYTYIHCMLLTALSHVRNAVILSIETVL